MGVTAVVPWPKAISMLSPVYQLTVGKAFGASAWSSLRTSGESTRPWASSGRSMLVVSVEPVVGRHVLDRGLSVLGLVVPEEIAQVVEVVVRRDREGRGQVDLPGRLVVVVVKDAAVVHALQAARHRERTRVVDILGTAEMMPVCSSVVAVTSLNVLPGV